MARAETLTKLSLDEWARIFGLDPLHFNQVVVQDAPNAHCDQAWFQYDYQDHNRVSREEVARAIAQAEADIEEFIGYRLAPAWERDEWRPTARTVRPELVNRSGTDIRGYPMNVVAKWGYFISGGVEARSLLGANRPITWSDADGDGYFETGTLTATVDAGQDPCEVEIFYPNKAGAAEWEIRPRTVSIVGTTATITFRRELAVIESLQERYPRTDETGPAAVANLDANFLTAVDAYRHHNDPQTQGAAQWEPIGTCGCNSATCYSCQFSTQAGCLFPRGDPRQSIVAFAPGTWDAATASFLGMGWSVARAPDTVSLYYLAGLRDKGRACSRRDMTRDWARTVAIYAASLLDRPVCECGGVSEGVKRWQRDLAFETGADELASYRMSKGDLDNPFGTRAGAVYAWKRIAMRPDAARGHEIPV